MRKKKIPKRIPLRSTDRKALDRLMAAQRIRSWKSNLDGCLRFLEGIPYQEDIHGRGWVDKMVAYYGGKADELLSAPPLGCAPVVPHYKRRLRQLRAKLYTRKLKR